MLFDLEHVGSRMAVARNIMGKTRPEIAVRLDVSPATYGKYERGHPHVLSRLNEISEVLCVSPDFLTKGPIDLIPASRLSYRRKVSLKSPQARHVQGMASLATEFTDLIEEHVTLPEPSVPRVNISAPEEIEKVVRDIRNQFKMSDAPLKNAVSLCESLGILVYWFEGDREVDGVSFWHRDQPYILLNKNQRDGYRARFTVMHELGHLVLHRLADDAERNEDERALLDKEADSFASAFLLPSTSFVRRFPRRAQVYDILDERSYWMVSCAAMVRRAWDLRLINEEQYRRLSVTISAKGWRKGEPMTPTPEGSRIHRFFLDEAGESGLTTLKMADRLLFPAGWVREALPESEQYQQEFSLAF